MEKVWSLPEWDEEKTSNLAVETGLHPSIAGILTGRGIESLENAQLFFNPSKEQFHDPFLMLEMEVAVETILDHIEQDNHILIYGDYDVDGTTAASILYLALNRLGAKVSYYIPGRIEGYGLSMKGIDAAHQVGVRLIVSCDCGITAFRESEFARSLGIDLVISDHHETADKIPEAVAVVDPKREGEVYPFRELSGAGVALKIVQALNRKTGKGDRYAREFWDLAAIGTAADIVPMQGENRVITALGLPLVSKGDKVGIKALLQTARITKSHLDVRDVVFGIAPRINAVGRIGSARKAVQLFTTNDPILATELARQFEENNSERRSIDMETLELAEEQLLNRYDPDRATGIVLAGEGWHHGVIGIVASRIAEKYYRPCVMISIEDSEGKGSARSIPGFNLFAALSECAELLIGFGGHEYAAGLTIEKENLPKFIDRFEEVVSERLTEDLLTPKLRIEGVFTLDEITDKLVEVTRRLAPFGPENMRPVLATFGVKTAGSPAIVGENHLKFRVTQSDGEGDGRTIDAIAFNMADAYDRVAHPAAEGFDIAYTLDINRWKGVEKLQLMIKDIH